MKLSNTHISYCTNIHGGEAWEEHFEQLKKYVPLVKENVSPHAPFGIGLRLSAQASRDLAEEQQLKIFRAWLQDQNCYVFTMNGFPYGDFHLKAVKDKVHFPDWTTDERLTYTRNLFEVLAQLVPQDTDAGISTSPLSYRFWFEEDTEQWIQMRRAATSNVIAIAAYLYQKEKETGIYMHLDIEPEPDGVLENALEFIQWYEQELLVQAQSQLQDIVSSSEQIKEIINKYICLCYDVCHFALEYEDHAAVMQMLEERRIKIGKFQISSALKVELAADQNERLRKKEILTQFDEPIYLHQVIARTANDKLIKYRDLPDALPDILDENHSEWRSHFHVPIFLENYGEIGSTQQDILEVVALQNKEQRTQHIEVETYTWGVLPKALQAPIETSISRELNWLLDQLNQKS